MGMFLGIGSLLCKVIVKNIEFVKFYFLSFSHCV